MEGIRLELAKPYRVEDGSDTTIKFSAVFKEERASLRFMQLLNTLIIEFTDDTKGYAE